MSGSVPLDETNSPTDVVPGTGTAAAARTADVLLAFVDAGPTLGVTQIAHRLNISKAVVYRTLQSLASRQLVVLDKSSGRYRLGTMATALGIRALRGFDLHQVALPIIRLLQHQTGETATVSALAGSLRLYLDQVPSLKEVKMTVELGRPFPLHAGSSSKALLAFVQPSLRQQVLSRSLEALTPQTKIRRDELEAELAKIRGDGVATSLGERQAGAGSVAAPVLGIDGYAVGSVSVCGPIDRFDPDAVKRFSPPVQEAAEEISNKMGWDGKTLPLRGSNVPESVEVGDE